MVSQHRLESFFHEMECNGMTSFMEFMNCVVSLKTPTEFGAKNWLANISSLNSRPWENRAIEFGEWGLV